MASEIRTARSITRQTAREVARELDYRQQRRRWRRNGALAGGVVGAVLLAMLFLRLGQRSIGTGRSGAVPAPKTPPTRVQIRLDGDHGLTVNGSVASIEAAIAVARDAGGADVLIVGTARQGDVDALLAALRASGVAFEVRG